MILGSAPEWAFPVFIALSLLFGVLLIMPIGGGDMPTVIALLNSYAGFSACAMGFALQNHLLIIAGALNAASGFILSVIMCKAMNRSFTNVLFGAFGQVQTSARGAAGSAAGAQRYGGRCRHAARSGAQGDHRSGIRHGGGAGPAQARRTGRMP